MKIRLAGWVGMVLLICFGPAARATIRYVDASPHTPVSPYTSWATAAINIQDAINISSTDTILVNDGVYKSGGVSNAGSLWGPVSARIFTAGRQVTIQSVNGPAVTTIKGLNLTCAFLTDNVTLSGFTLMNGTNNAIGTVGGVYCYSTNCIVTNCIITDNQSGGGNSSAGGAMHGILVDCVVSNNTSLGGVGGSSSGSLVNCTIVNNHGSLVSGVTKSWLDNCVIVGNSCNGSSAAAGGALLSTLFNCTVSNNVVTGTSFASGGGLADCTATDSLISSNRNNGSYAGGAYASGLNRCVLQYNYSGSGGGAYGGTLTNCILANNTCPGGTGGGAANAMLYNCLLTANTAYTGAGAASCSGINCTITGNQATGSGIGAGAYHSTFNNSIIYFNQAVTNADIYGCYLTNCCTPSLAYANIANSFTNDPLFVDPTSDFHLQGSSPCINGGNTALVIITNDLDGNPRIAGNVVDVGAYEYQSPTSVIAYAWLQQYGLPVDGSADFTDDDGDGVDNWHEWIAGSDPTDAASFLQMYPAAPTNNPAGIVVSWQSASGKAYVLQRSSDLSNFPTIRSNIMGQAGMTSYNDTNAVGTGPFFYRVGVWP